MFLINLTDLTCPFLSFPLFSMTLISKILQYLQLDQLVSIWPMCDGFQLVGHDFVYFGLPLHVAKTRQPNMD